jgi:hypothetical protein
VHNTAGASRQSRNRRATRWKLQTAAAESAGEINHQTNQEDESKRTATIDGTTQIETTAAEQEENQQDDEDSIHDHTVTRFHR